MFFCLSSESRTRTQHSQSEWSSHRRWAPLIGGGHLQTERQLLDQIRPDGSEAGSDVHHMTKHSPPESIRVHQNLPESNRLHQGLPEPAWLCSVFGVDLLVEEVLGQQVQLPVLLSDSVGSDELELLQSKLIEVVLHLPDAGLLQLGDGLLGGRLLLAGLPQVGLLTCNGGGVRFLNSVTYKQ